ncbi:hypothetical protein [Rathayibacter sp. AY1D4]|uniref:hypothetical protein n=1 Tax=Rathayibacter sp. AY1D4 TaxID=2080545 RepID=UPI0011B04AF5|nr:hypothetical protein [Rathayibacter sp. AY1D4]
MHDLVLSIAHDLVVGIGLAHGLVLSVAHDLVLVLNTGLAQVLVLSVGLLLVLRLGHVLGRGLRRRHDLGPAHGVARLTGLDLVVRLRAALRRPTTDRRVDAAPHGRVVGLALRVAAGHTWGRRLLHPPRLSPSRRPDAA